MSRAAEAWVTLAPLDAPCLEATRRPPWFQLAALGPHWRRTDASGVWGKMNCRVSNMACRRAVSIVNAHVRLVRVFCNCHHQLVASEGTHTHTPVNILGATKQQSETLSSFVQCQCPGNNVEVAFRRRVEGAGVQRHLAPGLDVVLHIPQFTHEEQQQEAQSPCGGRYPYWSCMSVIGSTIPRAKCPILRTACKGAPCATNC